MWPIPDSRYIPLTQQPYCCVPTCIQMVMLRHQLPLVAAELLGYHMGLLVPEDKADLFWHARTGERPKAGYGTQISAVEFEPNKAFETLHIGLRMDQKLIDTFENYEKFVEYLSLIEKADKDMLACYDWGSLFETSYRGGHVCVVDRVDMLKGEVRLVDPEYDAPKWRIVGMQNLYQAMVAHGADKSAGLWELSVINRPI